MRLRTFALLLTVAAPTGCPTSSEPLYTRDGFTVTAEHGVLRLRNATESTIHYVALERETAALVDLYFDPEAWPAIAPGEVVRLPYRDLMGYSPAATEALIHWWTDGEYPPYFVVPLR